MPPARQINRERDTDERRPDPAAADRLLAEHARRRDLCDLSLESIGGDAPVMAPRRFADGRIVEQQVLARYDAHGRWLEWLAPGGGDRGAEPAATPGR